MLKAIFLIISLSLYSSVYDITISTLEGSTKPMSDFQGKRLLIIILPITKNPADSSFLRIIDTLSRRYNNQIRFMGVPSFDDGYHNELQSDLLQYYRSIIGSQVVITSGMYTRNGAGSLQHPLFNWLCKKENNTHFDYRVRGVGDKFFIRENGELYGILSPDSRLNDSLMQRMLQ